MRLITVITHPNKTALLLADYLRYKDDSGKPRGKYYSYQIAGIGVNSPELVFNKLPTPLSVSSSQEFQIWYGQDLVNRSEDNNAGQTCADVYAWYAWQYFMLIHDLFKKRVASYLNLTHVLDND